MGNQGDGSSESNGTASAAATNPGHVMDLVNQFDFLSISLGGKIHCSLTNRDLPLRVDAVQQHLNSKKLKKEREWYKSDYSKYEPLIVAHKKNPKLLLCTLTGIELNRIPKEVEAHVNGKRFRNRKAEMEGLKETQRQPAPGIGDDDEFWAPAGGGEDEDDEGSSNEEDVEMSNAADGEAVKKTQRSDRAAAPGGKPKEHEKGDRKGSSAKGGGNAKAQARKAKRNKSNGSEQQQQQQENGVSREGKNKRTGKSGGKKYPSSKKGAAAVSQSEKATGLSSDDTPAVSNIATASPSGGSEKGGSDKSHTTNVKKKSRKANKADDKNGGTPEAKVVARVAPATPSAAKRKHKAVQEPMSSGKKKRKA